MFFNQVLLTVILTVLFSFTLFAQEKIVIKDKSKLNQATIEKLKASGLSDDMIKQLTQQLQSSMAQKQPKSQQQLAAFFDNYRVIKNDHYHLWVPINYQAQQEIIELNRAVAVFQRSFDMHFQPLQVVLFHDVKDIEYTGWQKFKGQTVLPFMTNINNLSTDINVSKAIGHEACHLFLTSIADQKITHKSDQANYGHASMPDWFDEAVAVSCEGPELQKKRRQHFAKLEKKTSLQKFVTQAHPLMAGLQSSFKDMYNKKTENGDDKQGMKIITLKLDDNDAQASENLDKTAAFYSMAAHVGQWMNKNNPNGWIELFNHYISGGAQDLASLNKKGLLSIKEKDLL